MAAYARLTKTRCPAGPCLTPFPIGYESDKIPSTKHSVRKQDPAGHLVLVNLAYAAMFDRQRGLGCWV